MASGMIISPWMAQIIKPRNGFFYAAHFSSGFDHLSLKSILCINAEFFMLHIYQSPMMIYCALHIHQTWLAGKSSEFTSMIRHDSPNETKP